MIKELATYQRRNLYVFKWAELVNALQQIIEKRRSENCFGADLEGGSSMLVRISICNRLMDLDEKGKVDLEDPWIQSIINEGRKLFRANRNILRKTSLHWLYQRCVHSCIPCLACLRD